MIDVLPNSLPRCIRTDWSLSKAGREWLYIYCANCGADGGRVLKTDLPREFAFYLCNSCAEKHGEIAGTMMVPDDIFWNAHDKEGEQCHSSMTSR